MPDESTESRYDFQGVEAHWQQRWREAGLYKADSSSSRPKFYGLVFFPYPSGAGISVGHCRNYIPLDVACRFRTMQGYNVLQPMGWDAFGQPAENEAIKRGRNPREMVAEYADNYRRQLSLVGIGYDWSREVNSSEPDYYRWTQWFFLLLYKRGLAYRASTPINWCPSCKTGLANEEVVSGRCWRCDSPVEKRPMPQWYFRITEYADRLIEGLDRVDWPEGIKQHQREWIGRSEGAEVTFDVEGTGERITVFTTRPDTLWGATFMVLAPEHPLVDSLTDGDCRDAVAAYREAAGRTAEIDRQNADRTKTGVPTGSFAINPVNGERIPIWIADYVLMGYGSGAIMAVPAHDQRDFDFARQYDLPIRRVYGDPHASETPMEAADTESGVMLTGPFAGNRPGKATVALVARWLQEQDRGNAHTTFRLRDWLISRQRYWGAPIPIIHCAVCGVVPVPEGDLPVLLPDVEQYQPSGTGESPLASIPEFVHTACPQCGGPGRRETDTMGGFACSSWYFLRFSDPHNSGAPFSPEAARYWLPVDLYVGGAEHAVMHLLYARFWTKVLCDAGLIRFDEPFRQLRNQGTLLALTPGRELTDDQTDSADGQPIENWKVLKPEERKTVPEDQWIWRWVKMSKSLNNVITPDEIAEKYGADSLRIYGLSVAPFEETVQWTDEGMEGSFRWVTRVWRLWMDLRRHWRADWRSEIAAIANEITSDTAFSEAARAPELSEDERSLRRKLHQTIRKVTADIEAFRFNTAIAAMRELVNEASHFRNALGDTDASESQAVLISELLETLTLLLSPFAPHLADELWMHLGREGFASLQTWPAVDEKAATNAEIVLVIQINGKLRDTAPVPASITPAEMEAIAMRSPKVISATEGRTIRKVITVPGKLVNVVIG